MPPEAAAVALPVAPPAQAVFINEEMVATSGAAGCPMVADVTAVQPLASVTVTVYVPAGSPFGSSTSGALPLQLKS